MWQIQSQAQILVLVSRVHTWPDKIAATVFQGSDRFIPIHVTPTPNPECGTVPLKCVCVCWWGGLWACSHIALQTGSFPQADVSLLTESYQEPFPQPVNTTVKWINNKNTYHLLINVSNGFWLPLVSIPSLQHWPPAHCRPGCLCGRSGAQGCWPCPAAQWPGYGLEAVSQTDAGGRSYRSQPWTLLPSTSYLRNWLGVVPAYTNRPTSSFQFLSLLGYIYKISSRPHCWSTK